MDPTDFDVYSSCLNGAMNPVKASYVSGPDADHDGRPDPNPANWQYQQVNNANQITYASGTSLAGSTVLHDRAGNMVFDGSFFYQYDGMNRLLAVCPAGTLTPADFDADGRILESATHTPDSPVVRFVYDGLGRLIRKTATTGAGVRVEDYYYDGVRRIQEVVTNTPSGGSATSWTDKEYVYGPDYVDEFVAQVDYQSDPGAASQVYYTLQDANYNVVALADTTGAIKQQYTYEPYGTLAATEYFDQQPIENNIGHQGLFLVRLDGQTGLSTNTPAIYYNRNRYYSPTLGRFIQRDPNHSRLPIIIMQTNDKNSDVAAFGPFNPQEYYEYGMNLYEYLGSNGLIRVDPSGCGWLNNFLKKLDKTFMFKVGFFVGGIYAAKSLDVKSSWPLRIAKYMTQNAGLFATNYIISTLKPDRPTSWEVMRSKSGGVLGYGAIKEAIMFCAGFVLGEQVYAMWDLFGD